MDTELDTIVPTDPSLSYDMKAVIDHVFDKGTFFEVMSNYAQNAVIGFARLHGQSVGVVGQQPLFIGRLN